MRKSANQLGNPDLGENYQKFLKRGAVTVPSADYFPTLNLLEEYGASLILLPQLVGSGSLPVYHPNDGSADFTVSRDSIGTYFDRDGILRIAQPNEPRLDYDPETREFKGVLVEPSSANLFLWSEKMNNNFWFYNQFSTGIFNFGIGPDGNLSATRFGAGTFSDGGKSIGNGSTFNNSQIIVPVNSLVTMSIFVKKLEVRYVSLSVSGNNIDNTIRIITTFDLDTGTRTNIIRGTSTSNPLGEASSSIQKLPNGWYKITLTDRLQNDSTLARGSLSLHNIPNPTIFNGYPGNDDGVLIWGAQLELGSRATSYIPTSGATVTRFQDDIRRNNISHLIGQIEGSVFVEFKFNTLNDGVVRRIFYMNESSHSNSISIERTGVNLLRFTIRVNSEVQNINIETGILDKNYRIVVNYSEDVIKIFMNGILLRNVINLVGIMDSINNIGFLRLDGGGIGVSDSPIKSFSLFTRTLTDEEAINLTKQN